MLAMSLSLVLESSLLGDIVASSEGVDGVRAVDSDDPEQSESDGDVDGSPRPHPPIALSDPQPSMDPALRIQNGQVCSAIFFLSGAAGR